MSKIAIIYDIFTVLLIVAFILLGYKKGFLRSIASIVSIAGSAIISIFLSKTSANFIFDVLIEDGLCTQISKFLVTGQNTYENISSLLSNTFPFMFDSQSFLNSSQSIGHITSLTDPLAITRTIKPYIVSPLSGILFVVYFLIFVILIEILWKLLFKGTKRGKLGFANKSFGAVFGGLKSIIIVCIIGFILSCVLMFVDSDNSFFSETTINSTYIFKYFYNLNLSDIFSSVPANGFNISDLIYGS
ncbi:MAG: hypothetical protein Q4B14_01845 [Clostridia bacterium]|nr:hypothetical protein [Clostridia bacterium]